MLSRAHFFSWVFGVALLLLPVAGQAQDGQEAQPEASAENTARARTLFADGVSLAAEEQFEEAAARFRAAYGLRPAPAIAYNLAAALVELDQLLEASGFARSVQGDDESTQELVELSVELQGRIEERLARLSVIVDGDHGGASIEVDGRRLSPGELGVPIPMNPGTHEVTASRGEEVVERQEAALEVGGTATVSLSPSTWPDAQAIPEPEPEPESTGDSVFETWWFWTIVGVVVVGTAIGIGAAASGGVEDPVNGDTMPAVLTF